MKSKGWFGLLAGIVAIIMATTSYASHHHLTRFYSSNTAVRCTYVKVETGEETLYTEKFPCRMSGFMYVTEIHTDLDDKTGAVITVSFHGRSTKFFVSAQLIGDLKATAVKRADDVLRFEILVSGIFKIPVDVPVIHLMGWPDIVIFPAWMRISPLIAGLPSSHKEWLEEIDQKTSYKLNPGWRKFIEESTQ